MRNDKSGSSMTARQVVRFPIASPNFKRAQAAPRQTKSRKTSNGALPSSSPLTISTPTSSCPLPGLSAVPLQSSSACAAAVLPGSAPLQSSSHIMAPGSSAAGNSLDNAPSTDSAVGSLASSSGAKSQDQAESVAPLPWWLEASNSKAVAGKDSHDKIDSDADDFYGEEVTREPSAGPSNVKKETKEEAGAAKEAKNLYELSGEDDDERFEVRTMPDGSVRKCHKPKCVSERIAKRAFKTTVTSSPRSGVKSAAGSSKSSAKRNHQNLVDNDFSIELGKSTKEIETPVTRGYKTRRLLDFSPDHAREE